MALHPSRIPTAAIADWTVLSLCTGYGGLDLGLRLAVPRARVVCHVEIEAFAVENLVSQMAKGRVDSAPIWSNLKTFDGRPWRGKVDCIVGGYPCQPFSIAGRRLGAADPRHLWPSVSRIAAEILPEWVFFENVSNHLKLGFREVGADLEGLGYCVEPGLFSSAEVGASHLRKRLFILGHLEGERRRKGQRGEAGRERPDAPGADLPDAARRGADVADAQNSDGGGSMSDRLPAEDSESSKTTSSLWATPNTPNGGRKAKGLNLKTGKDASGKKRQVGLENQATDSQHGPPAPATAKPGSASSSSDPISRPQLNPRFCEWLMGLPIGLTAYASPETGLTLWLQRQRSLLFGTDSMTDVSREGERETTTWFTPNARDWCSAMDPYQKKAGGHQVNLNDQAAFHESNNFPKRSNGG